MLPYFEEFKGMFDESKQAKTSFISSWKNSPKSIFDMTEDEFTEPFNAMQPKTFCSAKCVLREYLEFARQQGENVLKQRMWIIMYDNKGRNTAGLYYFSIDEMLDDFDEIRKVEFTKLTPRKQFTFDGLVVYYILVWYGLEKEDVASIHLSNVNGSKIYVPSLKQEIEITNERAADFVKKYSLIRDIDGIEITQNTLIRNIRKAPITEKSLTNLKFVSLISRGYTNPKFDVVIIKKSGMFERFAEYESSHGDLTTSDNDIIMELCLGKFIPNAHNIWSRLTEYHNFCESKI